MWFWNIRGTGVISKIRIYIISKFLRFNFLSEQRISAPWALIMGVGLCRLWSWFNSTGLYMSLVSCRDLFHCLTFHFVDQLEGFLSGFIQSWPNWAFYHKLGYGENFLLRDYIYLKFRIHRKSITIVKWVFWIYP